jgi:hypothetical protein
MALWKIEPTFKKSLLERCYYFKDGKTMMIETGWRWGEFTCETVEIRLQYCRIKSVLECTEWFM